MNEYEGVDKATERELKSIFRTCRKNAFRRGIDFKLSERDVFALFVKSGGRCALTGIPFEFERTENYRRPWVPSIDRISNMGSYRKGNVRLVCAAVNMALNEWGVDVLVQIARKLVDREGLEPSTCRLRVGCSTD